MNIFTRRNTLILQKPLSPSAPKLIDWHLWHNFSTGIAAFFARKIDEINTNGKDWDRSFRTIIEKSCEGFLATNADGEIDFATPATSDLIGYSDAELKQMNYFMLLHPSDLADFKTQFTRLILNDEAYIKVRHLIKRKDGNCIWIESRIKNLLNDPAVQNIVFQLTDISQLVSEESKKDDYVSIASHELRSPITAIYGYMQLLKTKIGGDDVMQRTLARMNIQVNKMQGIITSMLDNTKIKAGEMQYFFTGFDLNDCIRESVDAIRMNAGSSHEVKCYFESPSRMVNGDEEKIARVLTNLLSNAIKYSPDEKDIEVNTALQKDAVRVTVTDHGIGIAKEKQPRLFQRFYRVDTVPKKISGLGLGLFISAEIVARHNGQCGVESIEGDGASFWFTLPLTRYRD